ncbi:hypothetical protein [Flagellimonas allohymeniacidonis]|uniref:Selenophosphate synthetase n=1 Tax=Flagellimonas allohymeniacidonis TaxID=2517819 RepID=A0A4Q8QE77_9FLAO|nr:hypothetical protein [Allomuricauda hymeniacidonis]TAI46783.1 hypothetical protein EW142_08755 [Allomuricauda hymeniacidonis]
MKPFLSVICLFTILIFGCKTEPKKETASEIKEEKSVLEKIADAHGFQNWNSVKEFHFTFNVDRDSSHFERSWVWKPKLNEVTAMNSKDTITYARSDMDSIAFKANAGFINDRYWVLAPFNLIWDQKNFEHTYVENATAPISKKTMQKLTIVYGNEGGYTPGDAYDFYFNNDHIIREWVFRKSNQQEPSMTTSWENYVELEGLVLAQDHKKADEVFNLNFTNLKVVN